jgi:hypothetical protein
MTMTTEEREAVEYLRRAQFSRGYHVTERYLRMAIHIIDRLTTPAPPATPAGDTDALIAHWRETSAAYAAANTRSEWVRLADSMCARGDRLADALAEANKRLAYYEAVKSAQVPFDRAARRGAQEGDTDA